jgi:hypothetical protein
MLHSSYKSLLDVSNEEDNIDGGPLSYDENMGFSDHGQQHHIHGTHGIHILLRTCNESILYSSVYSKLAMASTS